MRKLKLLLVLCLVAIAASASKTVYLAPGPWNLDGARFALYHFTGSTPGPWVEFTDEDNDGILSATFNDTDEKMIFVRLKPSTADGYSSDNGGLNWDNKWNQSADLDAPDADNLLYSITASGNSPAINVESYPLYTAADLLSDGWTRITTIAQGDISDKFYVFVAEGKDLMLGLANSSRQSSTTAFYQVMRNPALDAKKVWTLEANGGNYAMRNLYSNSRQMQTEYSGSSNDLRWRTNDQTASIEWTGLGLAYTDGAWSLTSTKYSRPLGIYNNDTGSPLEGLEIGANDAGKGQKFQIYAISRSDYWALAAGLATKANPVNSFTGLIKNQEIYNKTQTNLPNGWSEDTAKRKTDNSNRTAGTGLTRLEGWASTQWGGNGTLYVDYYQNITVPNGVYRLTALTGQDVYTDQDPEAGSNGKIYISNGTNESTQDITTTTEYITTSSVVSDGSLKVGMRADGKQAWVHGEDFRLEYLGKAVRHVALDLPNNGNITAGQWYKYEVAVDGDYTITAGTAANIIQTENGGQLVEDATGAGVTTGDNVALTVGTIIYYKSLTDNTLTVVANVPTYELGDVTAQSIANNSYIGSLTTFVLTYGDAATNDGEASLAVIGSAKASLKKNGAEVATGTLTANDAAKTLTATFSDITLATNANDYSIVIPAGAFGYEGQSVNVEVIVPFQTGLVADGLYYLQKKDTQKYLGRGGNYGTRAVVADLGISFELNVQTNGKYYLKNHDQSLAAAAGRYFGKVGDPYYTDATSAQAFIIASADGGYYLRPDADNYFKTTTESTDIDVPFDYIDVTATEGDAIIWVPISKEAYAANIAAVRNVEAAAIATSAGETAASVSALETLLADAEKFKAVDMTSSIEGAECKAAADISEWTQVKYATNGQTDFNANGTCGEVWSGIGGIKQEITGLAEGIYKVSVHATWRPGGKESGENAGNEINTNAWVYANTATSSNLTQLKSWYAGGATIDDRAGMAASGDTYLNDVYVYVSDGETLTIGLASPTECNGAWLPFFGWSLTYYKPKATFTASFVNGEKWDDVYAYVWNGGVEITDEFPGEKISKSSTYRRNGIDYDVYTYSYTGFEDPANIIFSDGASAETTNKTADLTFVDGMTDLSKVPYIDAYAVVGGNNGDETDEAYKAFFSNTWDDATQTDILTKVSEGVYSKTYSDLTLDKQTISYKIIKKDYLEATSAANWYDNGTDKNLTIDIPVKGIYDITFTFTVSGSVVLGVATKTAEAVTISDKRWATTVTNSPLDFSAQDFEAYTATVDGSNVVLTKVDDVKAETGVVLKLKDGEDPDTFYVPVIASSETDKGSLMFSSIYGFDIYASYTDNYYGLIVKTVDEKEVAMFALIGKPIGDGKVTIPAGKAFLAVPTTARELSVVFSDDETTGIRSIDNGQLDNIYDLQGRKVAQPTKGLYIVNGKKVVKK